MAITLQYYCNVSLINYIVHVTLTLVAHPIKTMYMLFFMYARVCVCVMCLSRRAAYVCLHACVRANVCVSE